MQRSAGSDERNGVVEVLLDILETQKLRDLNLALLSLAQC
ncbi:MAG: hypothetical protein BWY82_01317 [Verrucomicrobia bacterium ADurb.Bin474]|nr:MAG: hypothetical protein BWY82_01317 [Verrucomicrobia bacterium ADurb.Bin474]